MFQLRPGARTCRFSYHTYVGGLAPASWFSFLSHAKGYRKHKAPLASATGRAATGAARRHSFSLCLTHSGVLLQAQKCKKGAMSSEERARGHCNECLMSACRAGMRKEVAKAAWQIDLHILAWRMLFQWRCQPSTSRACRPGTTEPWACKARSSSHSWRTRTPAYIEFSTRPGTVWRASPSRGAVRR